MTRGAFLIRCSQSSSRHMAHARTHPDLVGTSILVDFEDRVVVLSSGSVVRFLGRSRFVGAHGDSGGLLR